MSSSFSSIAVIGAGTMGAGIAAQIANAGHPVLLLDLPAGDKGGKSPAELAVDRLMASDPPQLMHKSVAKLIRTGTIEDDFDALGHCDWIVEAVIERLDVKKQLYKRLHQVIGTDCIVTSNTSTIPISLLVEDMPETFRQRFAITHYFNPVRFMRLLELVRGQDTDDVVMDRLASFNDEVLGKGVVRCADTPGFLGNRVGVFALQFALHNAIDAQIAIDVADSYIGRPFGIPKTGIFGLYDLIGIDLMSDVASSLRSILPPDDAFHAVGNDPEIMRQMIAAGDFGNKSGCGFYRDDDAGARQVRIIEQGGDGHSWREVMTELPAPVHASAEAAARQLEPLDPILDDSSAEGKFARKVLVGILGYAASLLPDITSSPQDIDDAMKLGFNWLRGPFELIDAIGLERLAQMADEADMTLPHQLTERTSPYYKATSDSLLVDIVSSGYQPVSLPDGAMRFSMMRQYTRKLAGNDAASVYALENDLRLVEFHSKANALNDASMEMVSFAAEHHGSGIIIHNDAQHFSAGVDLTHFQHLILTRQFIEMDSFLARFQQAVKQLKYCPVPVVGAASGLAAGGGFEVLMHCDRLVVHTNCTLGLVEAGVGVVPSGGGVKESYLRWYQATSDWDEAAWKTWMQIGYAATGTSPQLAARYQYFIGSHDSTVMNRDRLLASAIEMIGRLAPDYQPPAPPAPQLASTSLLEKMSDFMDEGISNGQFFAHDKVVAMAIASIIVADNPEDTACDEQILYDRERRAFLNLARTAPTADRINYMLAGKGSLRN